MLHTQISLPLAPPDFECDGCCNVFDKPGLCAECQADAAASAAELTCDHIWEYDLFDDIWACADCGEVHDGVPEGFDAGSPDEVPDYVDPYDCDRAQSAWELERGL